MVRYAAGWRKCARGLRKNNFETYLLGQGTWGLVGRSWLRTKLSIRNLSEDLNLTDSKEIRSKNGQN